MTLSYWLRVVCLIGVALGLLQVAVEVVLWMAAPVVLRVAESLAVRQRERALYAVQLAPVAVALLLTGLFLVPEYVRSETNFAAEHVGGFCVLLAGGVYVWWGMRMVRGVQVAVRTLRFGRACRRGANGAGACAGETPVMMACSPTVCVALVGLLRPFIFISQRLMGEGGLDSLALEVVLDHERAHAAQRDNWKLLSLYCVPRLGLRVAGGKSWMQLWQGAAEWAADEDAVAGDRGRALALAGALVALARTPTAPVAGVACTYLASEDVELALRVERLLHSGPSGAAGRALPAGVAVGLLGVGGMAAMGALLTVLKDLPEHLLHLG